jgi:hypothetical protein
LSSSLIAIVCLKNERKLNNKWESETSWWSSVLIARKVTRNRRAFFPSNLNRKNQTCNIRYSFGYLWNPSFCV